MGESVRMRESVPKVIHFINFLEGSLKSVFAGLKKRLPCIAVFN